MSSRSAQARNSAFLTLACLAAAPFALVMLLVSFFSNFETFFEQKNFRLVAILCHAREAALVREESLTSLFFRSAILVVDPRKLSQKVPRQWFTSLPELESHCLVCICRAVLCARHLITHHLMVTLKCSYWLDTTGQFLVI